tara:strand:- start:175 stop:567 length:393 start_codon:yes stop_codon:yes gene_type:complete
MVSRKETMKIIKENLLLIFLLAFITTISTFAVANENDWDAGKYKFRWMHVPVVCGTTAEIQVYLDDNKFELISMSVGREGAREEGSIAYFVTYYLNEKRDQSIAAITSPSGQETCMMYRSFNLRAPGLGT